MRIRIVKTCSEFEREPLRRPFGFKGGAMGEIWQTVVALQSESGRIGVGLGSQNVLWADPKVFAAFSESAANALMYAVTDFALQHLCGIDFDSPLELLDAVFEDVFEYAKKITGDEELDRAFALNALTAVDNAAWLLYAEENGLITFEQCLPANYRAAFSSQHSRLAAVPLISFNLTNLEIRRLAEEGFFVIKVKLGQPGSPSEMLQKDKERLRVIHEVLGAYDSPHSPNGRIFYYLDANGRYDSRETLLRLLDYADSLHALEQILLLEEPFAGDRNIAVDRLPVRIAADESVKNEADVRRYADLGYGAIALKPIAKTLSETLQTAAAAQHFGIPCFCADLTVNPILVDWNKNVAARLPALPELDGFGLLETNGAQHYRDWQKLLSYHPASDSRWLTPKDGLFYLDEDFYRRSGGIFEKSDHYHALVQKAFVGGELNAV